MADTSIQALLSLDLHYDTGISIGQKVAVF